MGLHYDPAFGECKAWPPSKLMFHGPRQGGWKIHVLHGEQANERLRLEGWRVSGGEKISGQGLRVGRSKSTRIRARVLDFMRPLVPTEVVERV